MENSNNIEIKKLAFKLVLLFVFFVLLIITAVRWNFQQPVKSIKIEGTVVIPEEEISDLIKEQVIDTPKSNIKLSKLKEELHSVPLMDEAYSSYRTTDEIVIAISEKQIEALLIAEEGKKYFVDSDGKLLNYKLYKKLPDVPILRGIIKGEQTDILLLNNALQLINEVKQQEDSTLINEVSEIFFDKKKQAFVIILNENASEAIIGNKDLFESAVKKLSRFFKEKKNNKFLEQAKYIDLRFLNKIYFSFNRN